MTGRRSRTLATMIATRRLDESRERIARTWSSRSVTFPELTTTSSSARLPSRRVNRSPRSRRRLVTAPGARTTTTTPSRSRMETRARARGRPLSSTIASWSPGSACVGTFATTRSLAAVCGASVNCAGRSVSHLDADREPGRLTMRGWPRRSSAKPTEATSTTTDSSLGFLSLTDADPPPRKATRAGAAVNPRALGGPAPAAAGTSATPTASERPTSARFIVR